MSGYLFRFFFSTDSFVQYDLGNIFAPLMNASLVALALSFLKIETKFLKYCSYAIVLSQLFIVAPVVVNLVLPVHNQNSRFSQFVNQMILVSCFWTIFMSLISIRRKEAKLFLLASGPKAIGQFIKTLLLQGDFAIDTFGAENDFWLFNIAVIGSLFESVGIIVFMIYKHLKDYRLKENQLYGTRQSLKLAEEKAQLVEIYRQVAHDIRSPLTALKVLSAAKRPITESQLELLKLAVNRIESIARDLSSKRSSLIIDKQKDKLQL